MIMCEYIDILSMFGVFREHQESRLESPLDPLASCAAPRPGPICTWLGSPDSQSPRNRARGLPGMAWPALRMQGNRETATRPWQAGAWVRTAGSRRKTHTRRVWTRQLASLSIKSRSPSVEPPADFPLNTHTQI